MGLTSSVRTLTVFILIIGLAGCQYAPGIAERSTAFNEAVADASNALLLRNIVRASERLPTYYSRIQGNLASGSVTPSLGVTFPLTKSFSYESDTGAGKAITGTKSIDLFGAFSGTAGLSGAEANTLTLQTMDDQKYQAGMMKALDFTQLKGYFDEGYSRDLLMLMFVAKVSVNSKLIPQIDEAVNERCKEPVSEQDYDCQYIVSDPYRFNFASGGWSDHWSLQTCVNNHAAHKNASRGSVDFSNDAAQEILPPGSVADRTAIAHSQMCFEILLQDLLLLGLDITPSGSLASEVVDDNVPVKTANDPTFRLEMVKQNMKIVTALGAKVAILCRTKPDSVAFTLTFPHAAGSKADNLAAILQADENESQLKDVADENKNRCAEAQKANPPATSGAKTTEVSETAPETPRPIRLNDKDLSFTERSFEGMIYYLGEIVRADESGVDPMSIVRVHGRNPAINGAAYTESLFYASSALDAADAALSVKADSGKTYYLANLCTNSIRLASPKKDPRLGCSTEFPDNESTAVITLLNQVWGLQKEYSGPPAQPVILANPQ
jgi:hypothetical protein